MAQNSDTPETWDDPSLAYYSDFLRKKKVLSLEDEQKYAHQYRDSLKQIKDFILEHKPASEALLQHLQTLKLAKLRTIFLPTLPAQAKSGEVQEHVHTFVGLLQAPRKTKAVVKETQERFHALNFTLTDLLKLLNGETPPAVLNAETARTKLVEHNLRLAFSIAKKFRGRGMPLTDLIQEANIGLLRAIDKYDISKGHRFSTYATWWISQACGRALADKSRMIRLPVYLVEKNQKLNRSKSLLSHANDRNPTNEELSSMTGFSEDEIEKLNEINNSSRPIEDTPLDVYEKALASDPTLQTMESGLEQANMEGVLRKFLGQLSATEEKIIRLYFGLGEISGKIR